MPKDILHLDNGGENILTGYAIGLDASEEIFVSRVNEAGQTVWIKRISGTTSFEGSNQGVQLLGTQDGFVVIANSNSYSGESSIRLLRMSLDGEVLWATTYTHPNSINVSGILETDDGMIMVGTSGSIYGTDTQKISLMRLNNAGEIMWANSYSADKSLRAFDVIKAAGDGYYIAASYNNLSAVLIKVSLTGDVLWSNRYFAPNDDGQEILRHLPTKTGIDANGNLIMLGNASAFMVGEPFAFVIKTDIVGSILSYAAMTKIYLNDAAIINDNVYLFGSAVREGGSEAGDIDGCALVKLKTDFNPEWAWKYKTLSAGSSMGALVPTVQGFITAFTGFTGNFGQPFIDLNTVSPEGKNSECPEIDYTEVTPFSITYQSEPLAVTASSDEVVQEGFSNQSEEILSENIAVCFSSNQPPVLAEPVADVTVEEESEFTVELSDYFSDPDANDELSYWVETEDGQVPEWLLVNPAGTLSGIPDESGFYMLRVFVKDIAGNETIDEFTVTVTSRNHAPELLYPIADKNIKAEREFVYVFPGNTFEDIDGNALTYNAVSGDGSPLPEWLTFDPQNRKFTGNPVLENAGQSVQVSLTASDGQLFTTTVFTVSVYVNHVPAAFELISPHPSASLPANENIKFEWQQSTDEDGDMIRYTLEIVSEEGVYSENDILDTEYRVDGLVFNPGTIYTWRVTATDNTAETHSEQSDFQIVVTGLEEQQGPSIKIYPNPARDFVMIEGDFPADTRLHVMTLTGHELVNVPCYPQNTLDISTLPAGIFVITISGLQFFITERLVIIR